MGLQLLSYQKESIRRFIKNDYRLLVALPTGAGKTIVAVYSIFLLIRKQQDRCLVITPANLKFNIADTLKKYFPHISIVVTDKDTFDEDYKTKQVIVISYNFLRMYKEKLTSKQWNLLVVDELHYAKNITSETFKDLAILGIRTKYFLGLTASPYSNNPYEFFTLLYIVSKDREVLKKYNQFIKYKTKSIKSPTGNNQSKTYPVDVLYQKLFKKYFGRWIYWPTEEVVQNLSNIPKPILHLVKVPITRNEYLSYKYALQQIPPQILKRFKMGELSNTELIKIKSWLTKAEQVLLTPQAITTGPYTIPGSKIKFVGQMIKKRGNQSIVFAQFLETGVRVANEYFDSIGLNSVEYSGDVKLEERRRIEDAYNNGEIDVICLTTAGMEGINLPTCKDVYFLNLHFNPEVIKQVQGRALRVTSKNKNVDVFWILAYYKQAGIIAKSTIDAWLADIVLNKKSFRDKLQSVLVSDYVN